MAEQDESQKTEEPTSKRLEDALNKGQVITSQEMKTFVLMIGVAASVSFGAGWFGQSLFEILVGFMSRAHEITQSESGLLGPITVLLRDVFFIMIFPFVIFIVFGVVSNTVQHPTKLTFEKLKPDLSKVSPMKGLKRYVSSQIVVEAVKTIAKLVFVTGIVLIIVWPERARLDTLMQVDVITTVIVMKEMAEKLLIGILIFLAVVATLDYTYQKWKYMKDLRMTKQEVKDERKQMDGDPLVKRKIARLRMERANQRMMANVPNSDVVVTNPTHFAVALAYKHGEMEVPRVLAKGVDTVALRIREVAEENGVAIVENPPLARALYATVDIDDEIPPEHYKTVAGVIGYVMKLKRAGMTARPKRPANQHADQV